MKKQLLALAIGSLVALPSVALADKGPTVYGKVNVSYENADNGTDDAWELNSNASRLGVKGALDLDVNNLEAIYKAEFEISVDDGDKKGQTFAQRNIYGGFAHASVGTLIAGKFDTPLKASQGKIDQFGDLGGDLKHVMGGDERVSDIIQYSTPTFADALQLNFAFVPGEDAGGEDDGPADAFSGSLVYETDMIYAAIAYDSEMETEIFDLGDDAKADTLRLGAKAKLDIFEIGAMYQMSETSDEVEGVSYEDNAFLLSAAVKLDRWKLKAQYGLNDLDQSDDEVTLMAVGADYKLAKNSKVFGYFSQVEEDKGDLEDSTFGIGFEHKFSM